MKQHVLIGFVLTAISLVAGTLLPAAPVESPGRTPNILVILSDDMGWGQLGFQGGREVPTPHLDRLAREGVRLTQFYVQAVCSPTRAALMTGRYPFRNGMEERTLAQALKRAGYDTAIFGRRHGSMRWHASGVSRMPTGGSTFLRCRSSARKRTSRRCPSG